MKINVSNNINKTKTIVLGDVANIDEVEKTLKISVPTTVKKILEETKEDLKKIKKKIEEFGITVIKANPIGIEDSLNVRNYFVVIDDCLYISDTVSSLEDLYKKIDNKIILPDRGAYCPNIFISDDYVVLDGLPKNSYYFLRDKLKNKRKIITAFNEGHSDGMYTNLQKKLWITNGNCLDYKKFWPDNDVFELSTTNNGSINSWKEPEEWLNYRKQIKKTKGRYFIYGHNLDETTYDFIDRYLKKWLGYCDETLFDLNFIVIDAHNIIAIGNHSKVYDKLKEYNINVHPVEFRHRWFWDTGLHCLTNELERSI
jgi:hypothetical protein